MLFLGIEIGGTKLQLGVGEADGTITALHRSHIDPKLGAKGILETIENTMPEILRRNNLVLEDFDAIGVGYGGPTDDSTQSVIKSHHVEGWTGFPLGSWLKGKYGRPAFICNDADVAGLAESLHGAGRGFNPIYYMTVGSGIGGGLIIDGEIYRGVGKGAAEVGHLRPVYPLTDKPHDDILEHFASGWGIGRAGNTTGVAIAEAAKRGNSEALRILDSAIQALAEGCCSVIKLLCPARIIIGGGVSLIGEELLFKPLRKYVAERGMQAFAGLTEIVPAALGEEVVVHGALALARKKLRLIPKPTDGA